jgi:hypothetical protein
VFERVWVGASGKLAGPELSSAGGRNALSWEFSRQPMSGKQAMKCNGRAANRAADVAYLE